MNISKNGINLIKNFEGYREKSYQCEANKWTIGYGHTLNVKKDSTCTKEQAEEYLKNDLKTVETAVNKLVKVKLNQNQYDALCSLVFNIGVYNFSRSTLLKFLNNSSFLLAANQFDKWIYVKRKISNGLIVRRKKEKELFLNEIYLT